MVSISGLINKAFLPATTKSLGIQKTTPEILTRVTGSCSQGGGTYSVSGMTSDAAIKWYERVSIIFRCVDLIATTQCSVPIVLRNQYGEGELQDDPNLYRLLNYRPNDYEDASSFRYRVSSLVLLDPRGCLLEVQRSQSGAPVALHVIPPGSWIPYREQRADGKFHTFVDEFRVSNGISTTKIKPENAIWIKGKPHPSDPYSQMTPLSSARLAAETDFFARLFNRNFLVNDGRPGLLIAVKGNISEDDAEELRQRFSGGYTRAGLTTVIESDGLDIQDLASSPRDIQWDAAVNGSSKDIMLAFGTPESVLGNASGRTFNNADAEWGNFWELTMQPHCNAITIAMDKLTDDERDDIRLIHDYSKVPVLQLPRRDREAQSLERWKEGVITLNEHLEEIGKPLIDEDYANVRFLHNNIIAGPKDMAEAVGKLPVVGLPVQPDMAQLLAQRQQAYGEAVDGSEWGVPDQTTVTQLSSGYDAEAPTYDAELYEGSYKALELARDMVSARAKAIRPALPAAAPEYNRDAIEGTLYGILGYWSARQGEVTASRLDHAKFREGTRFWEGKEEKAAVRGIDPNYPVEPEKWADDLADAITTGVKMWIEQEITRTVRSMSRQGVARKLRELGVPGDVDVSKVFGDMGSIQELILEDNRQFVHDTAMKKSQKLVAMIQDMESEGESLEAIKAAIKRETEGREGWSKGLAIQVVTSTMERAKAEVYGKAGALFRKTWNTYGDEKVREAHASVAGRTIPASNAFMVAGTPMQHPGDLTAPPALTANCRCWCSYQLG